MEYDLEQRSIRLFGGKEHGVESHETGKSFPSMASVVLCGNMDI